MARTHIGDGLIHYQQVGRGPDVVLVHGLLSNLAFWYFGVAPLLAAHFRVTAYDLRGHGFSAMSRGGYTSRDLAGDLLALLDHLQIERAHLVAHSFGGAVALHVALLRPERVHTLVQADTHVPALERRWRAVGDPHAARVRGALRDAGVDVPETTPRALLTILEDIARPWSRVPVDGSEPMPVDRPSMQSSQALLRSTSVLSDIRDPAGLTIEALHHVIQPTLAVFGERTWCGETLRGLEAHLPDFRRVIVAGAGHEFPLVEPEALSREFSAFVAKDAL